MNFENQSRVKEFNRQTNQFNKEGAFRAQTANQGSDQLRYDQILKNAVMREAEDTAYNQTASQGLNNIANSLGAIGKENWMANIIDKNPYLLYGVDGDYKQRPKKDDKKKDKSVPLAKDQIPSKAAADKQAYTQALTRQVMPALFPANHAANPLTGVSMMLESANPKKAFGGKIKKRKKRK